MRQFFDAYVCRNGNDELKEYAPEELLTKEETIQILEKNQTQRNKILRAINDFNK